MRRREFLRSLTAAALLSGCGRGRGETNVMEVSSLQSRAAEVPVNQLMWEIVDRLEAERPEIEIVPASGGGGGYQELMIRVMEGNPPDVMSFSTAETGLTYAYIEQGHVLDMTDYLRGPSFDTPGVTWLETIDPRYHDTLTYEGRYYAIPQNVVSLQIYCNAALYEQAGADRNPATWEEFLESCERLKRAGIVPITQDGIHWYTSWWFDHLAQRLLGPERVREAFRDPERRTKWTESGFLRAVRMIGEMLDRGYFVAGFSGLNHIESELLFWQGKAATIFVGTWFTSGRAEVMGEGFRLWAYRFPHVAGGDGSPNDLIGTVNTLSIPAAARHPNLAAEFLRRVSSRRFQERLVEEARMVSPYPGMKLPDVQQGLDRALSETERFHPFSFGLEGAHPFLYRHYWSEWNRYMVARELTAEQLVENLEDIFARYYRTAEA